MQILHHHKKGKHLNTIERYYIHAEHATNNHSNDEHTIFPNKIFDTLLKTYHPQTRPLPDTPTQDTTSSYEIRPFFSSQHRRTYHLYAPHITA